MQEKRKSIRKPCSDKYLIQYSSSGGNTSEEVPIYLRDLSDGGISGTFFGEQIPSYDEIHYIQDNKGAVKPARLIWAIQSVSTVYMLGFKFENSIPPDSTFPDESHCFTPLTDSCKSPG